PHLSVCGQTLATRRAPDGCTPSGLGIRAAGDDRSRARATARGDQWTEKPPLRTRVRSSPTPRRRQGPAATIGISGSATLNRQCIRQVIGKASDRNRQEHANWANLIRGRQKHSQATFLNYNLTQNRMMKESESKGRDIPERWGRGRTPGRNSNGGGKQEAGDDSTRMKRAGGLGPSDPGQAALLLGAERTGWSRGGTLY